MNLKYYQALKVKKKVEVLEETGPIPEKKDYGDKVVPGGAQQSKFEWPSAFLRLRSLRQKR